MDKKNILSKRAAKNMFVSSIHRWMTNTIGKNHPEYVENFKIEKSSIFCELPSDFFDGFVVPEGTVVELKFVEKRS